MQLECMVGDSIALKYTSMQCNNVDNCCCGHIGGDGSFKIEVEVKLIRKEERKNRTRD